jgi:hypothetical protein
MFIPNIQSLLASSKSDDELSEELLEIIGYDDIELLTNIMPHRVALSEIVSCLNVRILTLLAESHTATRAHSVAFPNHTPGCQ